MALIRLGSGGGSGPYGFSKDTERSGGCDQREEGTRRRWEAGSERRLTAERDSSRRFAECGCFVARRAMTFDDDDDDEESGGNKSRFLSSGSQLRLEPCGFDRRTGKRSLPPPVASIDVEKTQVTSALL